MYLHRPSGEYRALYWHHRGHKNHTNNEGETLCYILRVPRAREPRHIVLPAAYRGIVHCPNPPVMIRGCLHWDPGRCSLDTAVVFDTEAESFRSMRLPAAAFAGNSRSCTRLHDMDGMLGLSCFDESGTVAEVWVLEDYEREVWSLKYKINFSSDSMCSLAKRHLVLSHEGDMLLYSNSSLEATWFTMRASF
ncbi:hypothetical protein BRADI_4g10346v3 [Brachypodium distachyon]|uniref:F-box associated beta-propeller type 3 domain-containing protein n=1 Tax=Brachypodium distachyon TaxID=15368 RepID=A0A2K2CLT0_BRADI|nr:hypothetical protein BRADI_4g10346v3 [Brachypodium distachyon]